MSALLSKGWPMSRVLRSSTVRKLVASIPCLIAFPFGCAGTDSISEAHRADLKSRYAQISAEAEHLYVARRFESAGERFAEAAADGVRAGDGGRALRATLGECRSLMMSRDRDAFLECASRLERRLGMTPAVDQGIDPLSVNAVIVMARIAVRESVDGIPVPRALQIVVDQYQKENAR